MNRIATSVLAAGAALVCISPQCASGLDNSSPRSCTSRGDRLNKVPLDQFPILELDATLTILEETWSLNRARGLEQMRFVVAQLQHLNDPQLGGVLNGRVAAIYILLNKNEALTWLQGIPAREKERTYEDYKARAYSGAIDASNDHPEFQFELLEQGLAGGAFQITQLPAMLQRFQQTAPIKAALLFHEVVKAFPADSPTDRDVWMLLGLTQIMHNGPREDVGAAWSLMTKALDGHLVRSVPGDSPPEFLPAQMDFADVSLESQVTRLGVELGERAEEANVVVMRTARAQVVSPALGAKQSPEFRRAIAALQEHTDIAQVLSLMNKIESNQEKSALVVMVLGNVRNRSDVSTAVAEKLLDATEGSDSPDLSLAVPRMIVTSALRANNVAAAQIALSRFATRAVGVCSVAGGENVSHGLRNAEVCIQEYDRLAAGIARSPARMALQISDPSLIERLDIKDAEAACSDVGDHGLQRR